MANLDRFIEEIHLFEKANLTEDQIQLINEVINRVDLNEKSLQNTSYLSAVQTLYRWVKRVLQ